MKLRFAPLALCMASVFLMSASTPAASLQGSQKSNASVSRGERTESPRGDREGRRNNSTAAAPEIDPGLVGGGLALLLGGTLVLLGRRRAARSWS